jgi:hypothetical protein
MASLIILPFSLALGAVRANLLDFQDFCRSPRIGRFRQNLTQRCPQAGMIIGHDKFDAMQTTRLQPEQEIPPA